MNWSAQLLVSCLAALVGSCERQENAQNTTKHSGDARQSVESPLGELKRKIQADLEATRELNRELEEQTTDFMISPWRSALVSSSSYRPTFVCVIEVDQSHEAHLRQTLQGRVHTDYASYLTKNTPGLYLVGRLLPNPKPDTPPYSTPSFCYPISRDGKVLDADPADSLTLEETISSLNDLYGLVALPED